MIDHKKDYFVFVFIIGIFGAISTIGILKMFLGSLPTYTDYLFTGLLLLILSVLVVMEVGARQSDME